MNRKKFAVGIDIGNHFIKIVQLDYSDEYVNMNKYVIEKIPHNIISNGVIVDAKSFAQFLYKLLDENNIKSKNISLSIAFSNETCMAKIITLPNLKKNELKRAIESSIEDEFYVSKNMLYTNWTKIGERKEQDQTVLDFLLLGAMKEPVDSMVLSIQAIKLKPYFLELDCCSMVRALGLKEKEVVGLVDLGAKYTTLHILHDGNLKYSRNLDFGGFELIGKICTALGYSEAEAEEDLFNHAIITQEPENLDYAQRNLHSFVQPYVEELVSSLEETIDFYQDNSSVSLSKVIVLGGNARIPGMLDYIQSRLNIPCIPAIPHLEKEIAIAKRKELEPVWASIITAVGLALKEVSDNA